MEVARVVEDTVLATGVVARCGVRAIVPMHFATSPELADEAAVRAAFAGEKRLRVLVRGEETAF